MGTTEDSFHLLGSLPDIIDLLNNLVICGAMLYTVDLSIVAEIPSDPLALVVSSDITGGPRLLPRHKEILQGSKRDLSRSPQ